MAIQLNDRDHLIFKLIDEHQVLLEKHISWFIAGDDKPVLIRDRLRKLFYLDYLLCHRHASKLPWWTTPTKPLVYILSPMAKTVSGANQDEVDRFESEFQRHHLEVANLRMLFHVGQKDAAISSFTWTTCNGDLKATGLDAMVTFVCKGVTHKVGIINNPAINDAHCAKLEAAIKDHGINKIWIVSRDEAAQKSVQQAIAGRVALASHCCFATHHDLYRDGVVRTSWQSCGQTEIGMFNVEPMQADIASVWSGNLTVAQAISA